FHVTGVQTCALPILNQVYDQDILHGQTALTWRISPEFTIKGRAAARQKNLFQDMQSPKSYMNYGDSRNGDYKNWDSKQLNFDARSEERRVGKEGGVR